MTNFQKAAKQVPACCLGFDQFQHKTISDLVFMVQHEVDLYEEDDESDIRTKAQLTACKNFIARWRGISENDALGRTA